MNKAQKFHKRYKKGIPTFAFQIIHSSKRYRCDHYIVNNTTTNITVQTQLNVGTQNTAVSYYGQSQARPHTKNIQSTLRTLSTSFT